MTTQLDEMRAARRRQMDRLGRRRRILAQLAGQPTHLVPAAPIRAKVKAMSDLGWSFDSLAAMHGSCSPTALNLIASGVSMRCEQKFAALADLRLTVCVPESVADNMWVPTLGATRRVRGLLALGWRHDDITEQIGRSSHSIASGTYLRTRAIDWRIVDAAYERMSAAPGSSTRTAQRAATRGYVVPFAWNDIDDPREQPRRTRDRRDESAVDEVVVDQLVTHGHRSRNLTSAEAAEAVRRLGANGVSGRQMTKRYGLKPERYDGVGA